MATFKSYTELDLWQRARALENKIFKLTKEGSLAKDYALKDQMNRATGAIMDNIAEGFGRGSKLEFIQFLTISRGRLQNSSHSCIDAWIESISKCKRLNYLSKIAKTYQK